MEDYLGMNLIHLLLELQESDPGWEGVTSIPHPSTPRSLFLSGFWDVMELKGATLGMSPLRARCCAKK